MRLRFASGFCWRRCLGRLHGRAELPAAPECRFPRTSARRSPLPAPQAASLADLKWFEVFKDEKLQDLIRTALAAELRSARRGGARRRGARQSGHHALEPVSAASARAAIWNSTRLSRDGATPLPASFLPVRTAIGARPR